VPVIGINQYGQHPSLDNCRKGFLQGLADAGLTEGKDFTIDYQNAGFDNTRRHADRAELLVQKRGHDVRHRHPVGHGLLR
jgi:ABC-type uncharacterized transport system substrate-binding protein